MAGLPGSSASTSVSPPWVLSASSRPTGVSWTSNPQVLVSSTLAPVDVTAGAPQFTPVLLAMMLARTLAPVRLMPPMPRSVATL